MSFIPFYALLANPSSPPGVWVGVTMGPSWHHCPYPSYFILGIAFQPAPAQLPVSEVPIQQQSFPFSSSCFHLTPSHPNLSRVKLITHPKFAQEKNNWGVKSIISSQVYSPYVQMWWAGTQRNGSITCFGGGQLPCWEDVQAAQWRGLGGKELRPPAKSHLCESSWK